MAMHDDRPFDGMVREGVGRATPTTASVQDELVRHLKELQEQRDILMNAMVTTEDLLDKHRQAMKLLERGIAALQDATDPGVALPVAHERVATTERDLI